MSATSDAEKRLREALKTEEDNIAAATAKAKEAIAKAEKGETTDGQE